MLGRWLAGCLICCFVPQVHAAAPVDFSRDVLPILSDNCFHCHGPDSQKREGGFRLDDERAVKEVRDGHAAVVPGKRDASELVRRIISTDPDLAMPPKNSQRRLTPAQIDILKRWIDEGAVWGGHWAFRAVSRPAVPSSDAPASGSPVDAFILRKLQQEKLSLAPEAPRRQLIRRVTLDLTGLPPTGDEADAFEHDASPTAYESVVDRLLATPAFGERMAWDWLDAARYADSNGYQGDGDRTMWPWRDWVVRTLNENQAYDEFTTWQLAGDLLPEASLEQKLATGFSRNHMINGEGGRIPEENRVDYVFDMAETAGTVWLGLTFNCCRCHDHKFDPLSKKDYYSLTAFFNQTPVDGGGGNPQTPPLLDMPTDAQKSEQRQLSDLFAMASADLTEFEKTFFARPDNQPIEESEAAKSLPQPLKDVLKQPAANRNRNQLNELEKHYEKSAPEYHVRLKKLRDTVDARDALNRAIARVMIMADMPKPRETYVLDKGLYDKRGEVVLANVPAKLPALGADQPANRLGLAKWLTDRNNPLTARVTVNRIWQQFFGMGLVKTSEDFGVQSEQPVHPELLDWLAAEFMDSGWDVKHVMRLIVTSSTYRQSSRNREVALSATDSSPTTLYARDPENRLLARGPRYRLPAWMLRDQALAVSGLLVPKFGGPAVKSYQPDGVWEEATFGNKKYQRDGGESLYRRSLYTFWRRIVGPTMFFDNATRQVCTVKQFRTNTPLHALLTLNDVTYVEAARVLAERILLTTGPEPAERLRAVYRRILARDPSPIELQTLLAGAERMKQQFAANPEAAKKFITAGAAPRNEQLDPIDHATWTAISLGVLNLDETLTKE